MAKSRPSQPRAPSSASGRRRAGSRDGVERSSTPASKRPASKAPASKRPASKRAAGRSKPQPFALNEREQREGVRLQKFIASAGVTSRRRAESLITSGVVAVNGQRVTELGTRIFPGRDRVTVRGEPITAEDKVYFVLNKPDQMVCSAEGSVDERGRPTVLSLMHGIPQRLYPVGRLDYHSRGVVILTNDGELAAALTHPRHGVVKTYHVKFQGKVSPEQEDALREGVQLDDGAVTRPLAELFAFRETEANVWYQMGLTEGLNRQIRRMGDAIDHPVLKLIRVAIGDITADGLEEGEYRPLSPTEVGQLLSTINLEPTVANKPAKPAKRLSAPRRQAPASSDKRPSKARPSARPRTTGKPSARTTGKPSARTTGKKSGPRK
jgi:23S rRNA pseudouridine2605 synthase